LKHIPELTLGLGSPLFCHTDPETFALFGATPTAIGSYVCGNFALRINARRPKSAVLDGRMSLSRTYF